ncbi:MAG: serine hydrolase [Flammeovirgaceae bacterium]|nr:serine hydrolase [Flammeovirgaceae bacterium]HCX20272.1 serine hydrolase [Cytophagales bacterium]
MRLKSLLITAFYILVSLYGYSQDLTVVSPESVGLSAERLDRLESRFQEYVDDNKMSGCVMLVARKDQVAYYQSVGYSDLEKKTEMKNDAIFRIASQTKAIISVGIMILQEEGKLLIQDPVSKYIPEFAETTVAEVQEDGSYKVVPAKRQITIRDLLTHTAGIGYGWGPAKDQWEAAGIQGWYFANRDELIAETVKRMAALPMDAQPGEKWVYGYSVDILGVIIEKASGLTLDKFLEEKLFNPLGMKDTHFYLPKSKKDRLATVYNPKKDGTIEPAPKEGTMNSQGAYVDGPRKSFSGGAGLLSTAKDYYLFLQMLENEGVLGGKRILAPSTVNLMTVEHLPDYVSFRGDAEGFGLGFNVVTDTGQRGFPGSIGEYGWGGAYGSTYWVDPEEELVVVYFVQLRPGSIEKDQLQLRALIYQAIID